MSDGIDDQLRSRFQEAFPTSAQSPQSSQSSRSAQVLTELGPAMGRARLRRRAGVVGSSAVGIMLIGGAILGVQAGQDEQSNVVFAGPGPGEVSVDITGSTVTVPGGPDSGPGTTVEGGASGIAATDSAETNATATSDGPSTTSGSGGTTRDDDSTTTAPAPTTENSPTTSVGGTGSTTTLDDGSGSTTSLPSGTSEETVTSDCGSVVVGISGPDVSVLSVDPFSDFEHDIHNPGPEKIEVSFENGSNHCEIEARVIDGELVTEVENED